MTDARPLLLATDLTFRCDRATDRALALVEAWRGHAVAATVVEPQERSARNVPRHEQPAWYLEPGDVQRARQQLRREFSASAQPWNLHVAEGRASDHLTALLDAMGQALVVTGPVRSGALGPAVLGSTVDQLLGRRGTAMLMVQSRVHQPYRRLLFASDFSDACRAALTRARALFPEAAITVLHGYSVPLLGLLDTTRDQTLDAARAQLRLEGRAFLREAGLDDSVELLVEHGDPARLVQQYVDSIGTDLVVLGTHGRGALHELVVGSVARRLLTTVEADMLVVNG